MSTPKPQRTNSLRNLVADAVTENTVTADAVTADDVQAGEISVADLTPQGGSDQNPAAVADDESDAPEIEKFDSSLEDLRVRPGVLSFHVLRGNRVVFGRARQPGDTVEVFEDSGAFRDTISDGQSWLRIVSDPNAQVEAWGEVRFAPGPAPDPRLLLVPVPDFVQTQAQRDEWRASVVAVVNRLTAPRR